MTHIRTCAVAVLVTALAAIVFAAPASAASGTTLCKVKESPCSTANHYSMGTTFKTASGVMTLTRTWEKTKEVIECQSSRIWGTTTSTGGSAAEVEAQTEAVEFKECVLLGTSKACEDVWLTVFPSPKTTFANTAGTTNGILTMSGSGSTEPSIRVYCEGDPLKCTFVSSSIAFDLTGGEKATLAAKEEKLKGSGLGCPASLDWSGTYTFSEPAPLYISQSL